MKTDLIKDNNYVVCSKIKIHTKPETTAVRIRTGKFAKETKDMLVFDTFKAKKSNIVSINFELCN